MEQLFPTFDIYDLLGYLIPGGIMLFFSYLIISYFEIDVNLPISELFDVISASIIIVSLLFAIGFLIQAIGSLLERKLVYNSNFLLGTEYPSSQFMKEDDDHFPLEFKTKMKELIKKTFGLPDNYPIQKSFDLCYTYVIQNSIGKRVEKFLGLHAFCRGLYMSTFISGIILIIINAIRLRSIQIHTYSLIFLIASLIAFYRYKSFGIRFADAVYRDFYVHRITKLDR